MNEKDFDICNICDGSGKIKVLCHDGKLFRIEETKECLNVISIGCIKCLGTGQLTWLENILGKKY